MGIEEKLDKYLDGYLNEAKQKNKWRKGEIALVDMAEQMGEKSPYYKIGKVKGFQQIKGKKQVRFEERPGWSTEPMPQGSKKLIKLSKDVLKEFEVGDALTDKEVDYVKKKYGKK